MIRSKSFWVLLRKALPNLSYMQGSPMDRPLGGGYREGGKLRGV